MCGCSETPGWVVHCYHNKQQGKLLFRVCIPRTRERIIRIQENCERHTFQAGRQRSCQEQFFRTVCIFRTVHRKPSCQMACPIRGRRGHTATDLSQPGCELYVVRIRK